MLLLPAFTTYSLNVLTLCVSFVCFRGSSDARDSGSRVPQQWRDEWRRGDCCAWAQAWPSMWVECLGWWDVCGDLLTLCACVRVYHVLVGLWIFIRRLTFSPLCRHRGIPGCSKWYVFVAPFCGVRGLCVSCVGAGGCGGVGVKVSKWPQTGSECENGLTTSVST